MLAAVLMPMGALLMDVTICWPVAASYGLLYALVVCKLLVLRVCKHTMLLCLHCRCSLLINNQSQCCHQ
jgi:hypothetical protein